MKRQLVILPLWLYKTHHGDLQLAEELQKKVLCLYREQEGKRLSAMIVGNPKFTVQFYKSLDELDEVFKKFFSEK